MLHQTNITRDSCSSFQVSIYQITDNVKYEVHYIWGNDALVGF